MSETALGKIWNVAATLLGIFMLVVAILLLAGSCSWGSTEPDTPKKTVLPAVVTPLR